ncbi:GNAT family N-acetyltransferase [Flavobacterium sp. WC2409]|uniref:GNAT family N-acetyltransferase n=2 Tax=unclassified Flavobacterium TaxID=196869 RepID=A0AB39VYY1_9FLAO
MIKYTVKQYLESDYGNWNSFIGQAKNATFLFHRDFMDYHKERFQDNSLVILNGDTWVAVLPANSVGNVVHSHQGLTYGGLVYTEKTILASVIAIFKSVLAFLNENKIEKLILKTTPSIYHKKPAEELLYALFLADAKLIRRDTLSVIDLKKEFSFSKIRKRGIQKGIKLGLEIKEETDFESFWTEILIPNLANRHKAKPVHSLEEIVRLKKDFPTNIRQFNVCYQGKIVAGTTVFETETVVHCQYISKFEKDENLGSLDFLYDYLIHKVFAEKRFFDFGVSNEAQGKKLNEGLSYWKESFGASTIVHDFYEVDTINYSKLENILV